MAGVISRIVSFKLRVKHKSKPKTVERNLNDVLLSWDNVFEGKSNIYILQKLNVLKEWCTIYWGPKTAFRVTNLEPCTFYEFRLSIENFQDNWLNFKSATSELPFFVIDLTRAVKLGNTLLVRKIIQTSPHLLEIENKENKTPLIQAIENWDLQMVQFLFGLGVNINKPLSFSKKTPLMVAVYLGYLQIAQFLINKGANLDAKDINSMNILHYAVDSNRLETVEFCLSLKIKIDEQDKSGWSPLLRAVITNASEEIINFLIKNGADKMLCDKNGLNYHRHCELSKLKFI